MPPGGSENDYPSAPDLEALIAEWGDDPDADDMIRERLRASTVLTLTALETLDVESGESSESAVVAFTVEGNPSRYVPLFTGPDRCRQALELQPAWSYLAIVEVNGEELLAGADPEAILAINPWTDLEFQLPVRAPR
jgi:SseB protein N-terminal domain